MAARTLKPLSSSKVTLFKIKNRRGYAAVCMQNLTEGTTPLEAYDRMVKAVKRTGYELRGKAPGPKR